LTPDRWLRGSRASRTGKPIYSPP